MSAAAVLRARAVRCSPERPVGRYRRSALHAARNAPAAANRMRTLATSASSLHPQRGGGGDGGVSAIPQLLRGCYFVRSSSSSSLAAANCDAASQQGDHPDGSMRPDGPDGGAYFENAERLQFEDHRAIYEHLNTEELLRTAVVLRLCSLPLFVQHADRLLSERGTTGAATGGGGGGGPIGGSSGNSQQTSPAVSRSPPPPPPPPHPATTPPWSTADRRASAAATAETGGLNAWVRDALYRHFCIGHTPSDVWSQMNRLRAHGVGAILDYAEEHDATATMPLRCTAPDGGAVVATAHCRRQQQPQPPPPQGLGSSAAAISSESYDIDLISYMAPSQQHFLGFLAAIDTAATLPGQNFSVVKLSALADGNDDGNGGIDGDNRRNANRCPNGGHVELLESVSEALGRVLSALRRRDAVVSGGIAAATVGNAVGGGSCTVLEDEEHVDELFRRFGMALPGDGERAGAGGGGQTSGSGDGATVAAMADTEGWLRRQDMRRLLALAAELEPTPYDAVQKQELQEKRRRQERQLDEMMGRLEVLVNRAVSKGVKLIIDAEQSSMRLATELVAHNAMRQHNVQQLNSSSNTSSSGAETSGSGSSGDGGTAAAPAEPPASPQGDGGGAGGGGVARVFLTYQTYLTDTGQRVATDVDRAAREGYMLGACLVSGAYMHLERRWMAPPPPPTTAAATTIATATADTKNPAVFAGGFAAAADTTPAVCGSVDATHASFTACLEPLLGAVQYGGAEVMMGTHHRGGVAAAAEMMDRLGLRPCTAPVYFGQLLGMADNLSFALGAAGYRVYKLCPCGDPAKVAPYLARRVHETHYALQIGREDLQLAQSELVRRLVYGAVEALGATVAMAAAKAAAVLARAGGGSRSGGGGRPVDNSANH